MGADADQAFVVASWNTQGLGSKKRDICDFLDDMKDTGYECDILALQELRGTLDGEWFWHGGSAVILQRYKDGDNHMWMCLIVQSEVLDMTIAYKAGDRWQYIELTGKSKSFAVLATHLQPVWTKRIC